MIGTELIHISRKEKVRVLTEPFLHSPEGTGEAQQVILVEYLTGDSASKLEMLPVGQLPGYWKAAWQEDMA